MKQLRIRKTDDLTQIAELDRQLFPKDEPVELDDSQWWLAQVRAPYGWVTAAYAGAALSDGGQYVYLSRAGVLSPFRGRGLQKKLIDTRLRWGRSHGAKAAWTYTYWANLTSQRSLLARGFAPYTYQLDDEGGRFIYFKRELKKT